MAPDPAGPPLPRSAKPVDAAARAAPAFRTTYAREIIQLRR